MRLKPFNSYLRVNVIYTKICIFTRVCILSLVLYWFCCISALGFLRKQLIGLTKQSFHGDFWPVLFVKQDSLSSETELSQYFPQELSSHSDSDEILHQQSCIIAMENSSSQTRGNILSFKSQEDMLVLFHKAGRT